MYLRVSRQICIWNVICARHAAESDEGYQYNMILFLLTAEVTQGSEALHTDVLVLHAGNANGKGKDQQANKRGKKEG